MAQSLKSAAPEDRHFKGLPMYLMAGQMLVEAERVAEARTWLEAGLDLARARGDGKTAGELESELANAR